MIKNKTLLFCLVTGIAIFMATGCGSSKTIVIKPDFTAVIDKPQPVESKNRESGGSYRSAWDEDKPVSITSDRMTYREKGEVTLFEGNVNVRQEGLLLKAPYLKVESKSGITTARKGVTLFDKENDVRINSGELQYQQDMSNIKATGDVVFSSKDEQGYRIKMMSDRLEWQPETSSGSANGNVVVHYKSTTATAGEMIFSDEPKKIVLKSDSLKPDKKPLVIQNEDRITGNQITLMMDKKTYIITGDAKAMINTEQSGSKKGQDKNDN